MTRRFMSLLLLCAAAFVLVAAPASHGQDAGPDAAEEVAAPDATAEAGAEDAVEPGLEAPPSDLTDTAAWMEWLETNGIPILINVAKALAILIIAWIIAGIIAGIIRRQGDKREKLDTTLARFFANIVKWAILALAFISVLGVFGI